MKKSIFFLSLYFSRIKHNHIVFAVNTISYYPQTQFHAKIIFIIITYLCLIFGKFKRKDEGKIKRKNNEKKLKNIFKVHKLFLDVFLNSFYLFIYLFLYKY